MTRQQREFYHNFSRHGSGSASVEISPVEVALLAHIAYFDIFASRETWFADWATELIDRDFYSITQSEVSALPEISEDESYAILEKANVTDVSNYVYMYLKNLAALYRRRFKFYNILKEQPFPSVEQIGLRCLLEFGNCDDTLLFSWMAWRKLIYDIDNRSAQETGYLFEPIIASCLGGESVSHHDSPVKRIAANGRAKNEGRQIDCYVKETREVYELKLRVTIAASGQGRFEEEMSFPYEVKKAGLIPVLIVFDPTPSPLLEKLGNEFRRQGGRVAIGDDAWNELVARAGTEMGKFIVKYIKPPIVRMRSVYNELPMGIQLSATRSEMEISAETGSRYSIIRTRTE